MQQATWMVFVHIHAQTGTAALSAKTVVLLLSRFFLASAVGPLFFGTIRVELFPWHNVTR